MYKALGLISVVVATVLMGAIGKDAGSADVLGFAVPLWIMGIVLYLLGALAAYSLTAGKKSS